MPVGIDDIVWIAGDISNVQYTGTKAAISNGFFDGMNRKSCDPGGRSPDY
jgi:hypothetical protein